MEDTKKTSETKIIIPCIKCGQKLRIPIAYKILEIRCPKCNNEFLYNYIAEFGNDGAHYTKLQIGTLLAIIIYILLFAVSCIIFMALQIGSNFQNGSFLLFMVLAVIYLWVGTVFIPKVVDYKAFAKYLSTKLLLINRQGIIYFDQELKAQECINWNDITSAKYVYLRHMFVGLIETKREPACVELEVRGKGKVRVPPTIFFSDEEREKIIGEILARYKFIGTY